MTLPVGPVSGAGAVVEPVGARASTGFDALLDRAAAALGEGASLTVGEFLRVADGTVPSGAVPMGHLVSPPAGAAARSGAWANALPPAGRPWAGAITAAADEAGVDPRLLAAVVWAESGFRPDAVSSAGALGLTQLMPATAELLGVDPTDPGENLAGGARFLAFTLERFGRTDLGLAAYNAGPARVAGGDIPDSTHAYVDRVLDYTRRLGGTP